MTESEILALEAARCSAVVAADIATLDGLLADSLVYTHSTGSVDTKASYLASIDGGPLKYRAITSADPIVNLYDGVAVIAAKMTLEITMNGAERTINARATIVWAQVDGAWKFVAWQSTPLAG